MESFRKAYGALKDSTTVGLAKVNSEFKDLDIAIVKATNHVESPPKERHVRKIFMAVALTRPRADVSYCIHALSRRLLKTRNWIVAVKTLIVIHRTFREADPSFKEELLNYSQRAKLLQLSNFKDDSSPLAWNCSAWIRAYALFLEERLECFRALNYDIETDRTTKGSSRIYNKAHSRTRLLNPLELLEYLPALQLLLYRLMGCQPEGAACQNHLIQYALALVLKESFKIYCAINDGIINLVDMFFEMPKHNAVKALAIYKKAGEQAEHLADYYAYCKNLDLARTFHFPKLKQPPPSFLATMEEYIKETPQTGSVSAKRLEYREAEEQSPREEIKQQVENDESVDIIKEMDTMIKEEIPAPFVAEEPTDLLGLNGVNSQAVEWEETNALALAIVQPGNDDPLSYNTALSEIGKTSGWELALVSAPSNINKPQAIETKMGGGFDKLLLDSLYEDEHARKTLQLHSAGYSTSYGYEMTAQNPFDHQGPDPFAMSNNISRQQEQMMMLQNQHHMMMMQNQHNMMMVPYNNNNNNTYTGTQYSQQQYDQPMGSTNPFGDPFSYYPQSGMPQYGNHNTLL